MFEYVDGGIIKASILIVVMAIVLGGLLERYRVYLGSAIVVAIGLLSFASYQSLSLVDENMKFFKQGRELLCRDDRFTTMVSKEEKWTLRDDYFMRDSRMIRAHQCELYKKSGS